MKPTQEQVIAWAEEAGFTDDDLMLRGRDLQAALTLAYEAGRKDENAACAKVCDELENGKYPDGGVASGVAWECAAAIRARRS